MSSDLDWLIYFGNAGNLGVHQPQSCPGFRPYLSYEATYTEQRPDFNPNPEIPVGTGYDYSVHLIAYNMGTANFVSIDEGRTDTCGFNYEETIFTTPPPMPQTTTGPFEPIVKDIPHGLQVCLAHGDCDWINDPFQPCVNNDLPKSAVTSNNRIVDGIEAIPNSWPWAVRLIFQT